MGYQVALLNFEGPLDLLLQLIERADLPVTEISLAELTNQYVNYIGQLKNLEASELDWFIGLAAKLILLKSQALLPQPSTGDDDELQELEHQLAEYAQYREAAVHLQKLLRQNTPGFERPVPDKYDITELPLPNVQLDQLQATFQAVLAKLPTAPQELAATDGPTIEQMVAKILGMVAKSEVELGSLITPTTKRQEVVVLFLAVLELLKDRQLVVNQTQQFANIRLCRV